MTRILLALALLLALSSCATLSETQCRGGDWFAIGLRDGRAGRAADFLQKNAAACAEYGITPDVAAWQAGQQAGLRQYCTPVNAYDEGARGRRLTNVCPAGDTGALKHANSRGLRWYEIGRDIDEAEREIDRIDAALSRLEPGAPGRAALLSERTSLRLDILTLTAERGLYRR